jgi:hypothetical protein
MKPRRAHAETVVEGLEEERRALAERYTIDAEEARKREQLAAETAERDAERLAAAAAARAAEDEARRAAMAARWAEQREHQADRDLRADLDRRAELAHRMTPGTDSAPTTEHAPAAESPLAYGGDMLSDDSPSRQIERLRELSRIGDLLVEIADAIRAEEGPGGVLPYQIGASRLPILRGRLAIALGAARVLGTGDLEACRKVVETPPNLTRQALAGVVAAIEEVRGTLTSWPVISESRPATIGQLQPAWTKPTESSKKKKKKKSQSKVELPATAAQTSPPEPQLTMPKRVTQVWIEANVPSMSAAELGTFMSELKRRNWSDSDIATRVIPQVHD